MMTDNEIIKALECCSKITFSCDGCPLKHLKYSECYELVIRSTLGLINRQKAEIEGKESIILKQKEMIERTQKLVDDTDKNCRTAINIIGRYERQFKSIKAEAVKEFAERLKDYYIKDKRYDRPYAHTMISILFGLIDDLVEEMAGDAE